MMELKKHLKIWSLLLLGISIVGCATPEVVTKNVYVPQNIEIKGRPRPTKFLDVQWYVVTSNNIDTFLREFQETTGDIAFFAISVPHYENLSINLSELRRYIEQQNSLLLYYENSINTPIIEPPLEK